MNTNTWDVIIVGGGPAGLSTALHLAQRDPAWAGRVLIIEKARYPRFKLCGGGITDYGLKTLTRLGLNLDEIGYAPVDEVRLVYGKEHISFWKQPTMKVVRRDEFDAWLAGHVQARKVTVHQGETVLDVVPHVGGVTVRTSDGTYEARTLVAADGSKGVLRRKLGLGDPARVARLIEILTPLASAEDRALHHDQRALFDFSFCAQALQGYYWDFPCVVKGKLQVNRGVFDARWVLDEPKADLKALLSEALTARDLDIAQCELQGHPIRLYDPQAALALPHILLAGDAAGADPLLGEGIAFALGYGDIAAGAIADAFAQADFRYADYAERFRTSSYGKGLVLRVRLAGLLYRYRQPWVHWLTLKFLQWAMPFMPNTRPYSAAPQRRPAGMA